MHGESPLTPALLLRAYAEGIFPMAERRDDRALFWVSPEQRGIIPLDRFHLPRRLARTVKTDKFTVTADAAFADVMGAAQATPGRPESWINDEILRLYIALHAAGHAHSIECWREGRLVGGLYGVTLGAAFFGESMFSVERDASKVALVHLVARLIRGQFSLLDTQFLTRIWPASAPSRFRAKTILCFWRVRSRKMPNFTGPRLRAIRAFLLRRQHSAIPAWPQPWQGRRWLSHRARWFCN